MQPNSVNEPTAEIASVLRALRQMLDAATRLPVSPGVLAEILGTLAEARGAVLAVHTGPGTEPAPEMAFWRLDPGLNRPAWESWLRRACAVTRIESSTPAAPAAWDAPVLGQAGVTQTLIVPLCAGDARQGTLALFDAANPGWAAAWQVVAPVVGLLLAKPAPTTPPPAVVPAAVPSLLRMLVVDDARLNQKVLSRMLVSLGHQVAVANHGGEALELSSQSEFDVIFMDIHMPVMDGLEATRLLREREAAAAPRRRTTVVALTAEDNPAEREKCLAAGMDGFVQKPVRPADLQTVLAMWRPSGLAVASPPPPVPLPPPAPLIEDLEPVIRKRLLEMQVTPDKELIRELVGDFLTASDPLLARAQQACREQNAAQLKFAVHTLKGSASGLGLKPFAELCREVELQAAAARWEGLPEKVAAVQRQYTELRAAMAALLKKLS